MTLINNKNKFHIIIPASTPDFKARLMKDLTEAGDEALRAGLLANIWLVIAWRDEPFLSFWKAIA